VEEAGRQEQTALLLLNAGWGTGRVCWPLDAWKDPDGGWLQSFTIITTTPNELTRTVHNRMPVIVRPEDYEEWLMRVDGEEPPVKLLRPYPAEEMVAREAHRDVGNVKNNHPELLNSA
jgi:putative SOS response-associated peptidase YedK